jgi:SAM-dependent methyltransferase
VDAIERYLSAVKAEWPHRNVGNLRFYNDYLFDGVPLTGRRVLDVGAGDGVYSLYAAAAGAQRVVALEPEAAGSTAGVTDRFSRLRERLELDSVELRTESFQDFDATDGPFDVLFLHAVINHLDEAATMEIGRSEAARQTYRTLFSKLASIGAPGAKLVASDASPHNLFARLGVRNPLQPTIEWEKHQAPETWALLLEDVGFGDRRIRWNSINTFRRPGRILLGNRVAAWALDSSFCLTMTLKREAGAPSSGASGPAAARLRRRFLRGPRSGTRA